MGLSPEDTAMSETVARWCCSRWHRPVLLTARDTVAAQCPQCPGQVMEAATGPQAWSAGARPGHAEGWGAPPPRPPAQAKTAGACCGEELTGAWRQGQGCPSDSQRHPGPRHPRPTLEPLEQGRPPGSFPSGHGRGAPGRGSGAWCWVLRAPVVGLAQMPCSSRRQRV